MERATGALNEQLPLYVAESDLIGGEHSRCFEDRKVRGGGVKDRGLLYSFTKFLELSTGVQNELLQKKKKLNQPPSP